MRPPFITGSQAYGTPTKQSDIDLVVHSQNVPQVLVINSDQGGSELGSVKFGKLNLIFANDKEYDCWKEGTDLLIKRKPVTRDEAKAVFQKLRKEYQV